MRNPVEFARDVLGIKLYPLQAEALMGMASHQLVTLACGRRGGKSLLSAIWAVYDACIRDLRKHQRQGEPRYILLVAASIPQARALFRTVADMFRVPMLAPMVLGEPTHDEIRLVNGVILRVVPCSERTTRGLAASTVIFEELASYTDTNGYQSGEAVYRALAPSVAQSRSMGASSPYRVHVANVASSIGCSSQQPHGMKATPSTAHPGNSTLRLTATSWSGSGRATQNSSPRSTRRVSPP